MIYNYLIRSMIFILGYYLFYSFLVNRNFQNHLLYFYA